MTAISLPAPSPTRNRPHCGPGGAGGLLLRPPQRANITATSGETLGQIFRLVADSTYAI